MTTNTLEWQNINDITQQAHQRQLKLSKLGEQKKRNAFFSKNIFSSQNSNEESSPKLLELPKKRWGHASVEALDRMFIIGGYQGQYLGDIWMFDFQKLNYTEVPIKAKFDEDLSNLSQESAINRSKQLLESLQRSNHTSVFYKEHNSIYVFGGGHAHKKRFNDTLRIQLPYLDEGAGYEYSGLTENLFDGPSQPSTRREENKVPFGKSDRIDWTVEVSNFVPEHSQAHRPGLEFMHHQNNPQGDVLLPPARTYHAATLVGRFMVVVGGESSSSDLNDLWALDLENKKWYRPSIEGIDNFIAKRFHTANTIQKHKVITFGGCHSEYVHLNDLNVFDMENFLKHPEPYADGRNAVVCTKVDVSQNIPSTRWGHTAAVMHDHKLVILGGRNDQDISDLHQFDIETHSWTPLDIGHPRPKPRRRHSCILVSNCLVMFGGFDGEFYNDLHVMDLEQGSRGSAQMHIEESMREADYMTMVDSRGGHDVVFRLQSSLDQEKDAGHNHSGLPKVTTRYQDVYANRSLILYRTIEREVPIQTRFSQSMRASQSKSTIAEIVQEKACPAFLRQVFEIGKGRQEGQNSKGQGMNESVMTIDLGLLRHSKEKEANEKSKIAAEEEPLCPATLFQEQVGAFKSLLEYMYCDKFCGPMSIHQCQSVQALAKHLGLVNTAAEVSQRITFLRAKLQQRVTRDFQLKQFQAVDGDASNEAHMAHMKEAMESEIAVHVRRLEKKQLFDSRGNGIEKSTASRSVASGRPSVLSPEEEKEKSNVSAVASMAFCANLDEFFDVVFNLENKCYIKGNSVVLGARSEYFRAMFDPSHGFREVSEKHYQQQGQNAFKLIKIHGVPKIFFNCIIQYLYSDHFYIGQQSIEFFLQLFIYADYFLIPRLQQICSRYIKTFTNHKNVLAVLLMSHAHNSMDLETFCIDYICLHEADILQGKEWKQFKDLTQQNSVELFTYFVNRIRQFKRENFVQQSLEQFVRANSEVDKKRIVPKPLIKKAETKWLRNDKKGQLAAVRERPEDVAVSSSSSNSSAGSLASEESKQGVCDPESSSSSDASDELDAARGVSEVSLQKLLQTSYHIFVEEHNPLSFYEIPSANGLRASSMFDNILGPMSNKENCLRASHNIFDSNNKADSTEQKKSQTEPQAQPVVQEQTSFFGSKTDQIPPRFPLRDITKTVKEVILNGGKLKKNADQS